STTGPASPRSHISAHSTVARAGRVHASHVGHRGVGGGVVRGCCDRPDGGLQWDFLSILENGFVEGDAERRLVLPFFSRLSLGDVSDQLATARNDHAAVRKYILSGACVDLISLFDFLGIDRSVQRGENCGAAREAGTGADS